MVGGSLITFGGIRIYKGFFKRIRNSEQVSSSDFARKRWIKGVVTSVGDADNFRLYHTPGFGWNWPLKFRRIPSSAKDLKEETLHIRMMGIDAPEAAHFGKPAQPYAEEALAWLRNAVLGKQVWCQLLRRDQYGRTVAVPMVKSWVPFRYRCVSIDMLKAGWATVYQQSYAEYGKWGKDYLLGLEKAAQQSRIGMWQKGTKGETPAEYKRRYASGGDSQV
ncbi:SNase-domain-containing protein [Serendipita vermifera]|nr:SNase-domain-containing protein [Serendipita vermifera]